MAPIAITLRNRSHRRSHRPAVTPMQAQSVGADRPSVCIGSVADLVCAVRRWWFERRWKTCAIGLSQQVDVAGGSLIRVTPGRVGAALTTPGRSSTARWGGSGKRDEEEYARNRRFTSFNRDTDSNLADVGRVRCFPAVYRSGGDLPGRYTRVGLGGREEGLRRTHGEAAGTQSGLLTGHATMRPASRNVEVNTSAT